MLGPDQAIGTEGSNEAVSSCVDYIHGCNFGSIYQEPDFKTFYQQLYRRTFPEVIMTNRMVHDQRTNWKHYLNDSFIQGFRFDVAIFRSRKVGIAGLPEYAEYVKKLLDLKKEYARFFYDRDARYVCDTDLDLPNGISYTEYVNGNERLFALRNAKEEPITVTIAGQSVTVEPCGVACIVTEKNA